MAVGEVVYTSLIRIERVRGPLRKAWLPARDEQIEFGVHDEVADHYGIPRGSDVERSTTLDFVVAAAGG
jgi:hypothetical protein